MSSSDDSNSDNGDSNGGSSSRPGTPEGRSVRKLLLFAVSTILAALGVFSIIAVFNGIFGGGPFFEGFLAFFGFQVPGVISGPARVAFVLGVLLLVSYAVEIKGINTSVPFWVGIGVILLVVMKFIMPTWVVESIQFLGLVEFATGIPMTEVNVRRTAVLGVLFIVFYYVVLIRIQGALEITNAQGSTSAEGVLKITRQKLESLVRTYFALLVVVASTIATLAALAVGYTGESAAEVVSAILTDPGWGGWLVTVVAYYVNYLTDLLPFHLTEVQFFAFILVFLAIAVNERYS